MIADQLKDFGSAAIKLSRSPLGIIALFILLAYGFACLVVGASGLLNETHRTIMVWFVVSFPVVVLILFSWLVCKHHTKLYSPSDYKNEDNFIKSMRPEIANLPTPQGYQATPNQNGQTVSMTTEDWVNARDEIYKSNCNYFLAYILEPSINEKQKYDIFIYILLHKDWGYENFQYEDIERAEFFFGKHWGNKIYVGSKSGNYIGMRTSAYGPFLALCKITFKSGKCIIINKYIDFEMGPMAVQLAKRNEYI